MPHQMPRLKYSKHHLHDMLFLKMTFQVLCGSSYYGCVRLIQKPLFADSCPFLGARAVVMDKNRLCEGALWVPDCQLE